MALQENTCPRFQKPQRRWLLDNLVLEAFHPLQEGFWTTLVCFAQQLIRLSKITPTLPCQIHIASSIFMELTEVLVNTENEIGFNKFTCSRGSGSFRGSDECSVNDYDSGPLHLVVYSHGCSEAYFKRDIFFFSSSPSPPSPDKRNKIPFYHPRPSYLSLSTQPTTGRECHWKI